MFRTLMLLLLAGTPLAGHAELVAHWPLDDESGFTARNAVGNRHGTLKNFPGNGSQWQKGKLGGALRFDGENDYVEHFFNLPRKRGTLMHWIWPDTEETGVIYYENDFPSEDADYNGFNSGGPVLEIHTFSDGRFGFYYQDGEQENMASRDFINPVGWNHVAVSWDVDGDMVLYVNCEEVNRDTLAGVSFDNNTTTTRYFGRAEHDPETRSFSGLLDDVRVYDHAMPAEEIAGFCDLKLGRHSAIAASDGLVKDSTLVSHLCTEILANGGPENIKDITLLLNSPFGGGFMDDMEAVFGSEGACSGIPWVAAAASGEEEVSRGWPDDDVTLFGGNRLGSSWTQALAGDGFGNVGGNSGVLFNGSSGNLILEDLVSVGMIDLAGPSGLQLESPETAQGNGGDDIKWRSNQSRHHAILFGGMQTHLRHGSNLENVREALLKTWQGEDVAFDVIPGGTSADLLGAISQAALTFDSNTQFLVYLGDHGGAVLDFEEAFGELEGFTAEDSKWDFRLHDGWLKGISGNRMSDSASTIAPKLVMDVQDCQSCADLNFSLNGRILDYPEQNETGQVEFNLQPDWLRVGRNRLEIQSPANSESIEWSEPGGSKTQAASIQLSGVELSSGPVNDLELEHRLRPGQSAAYYDPDRSGEGVFIELLADQKAVVYVFSYDGEDPRQAWMFGTGELLGEGILLTEMYRPTGATFGENFDPGDVKFRSFGTMAFKLPKCGELEDVGNLNIEPLDGDFDSFESANYRQLTRVVDCEGEGGHAKFGYSGSWFDPAHSGEGIILEVLLDGRGLVQWFTYDHDGRQMWIQGIGEFEGETLVVDKLFTTSGTRWGDAFDPEQVETHDWGSMTLSFDSCDSATLDYVSTAGFGSGDQEMQRLTHLLGIPCGE